MRHLDAAQTAAALPWDELVAAIAACARELHAGVITAPERLVVNIDAASVLLCMPAIGPDLGVTKLVTVHADNAARGLPVIQGEVLVFERDSGRRLAMLDGPTVTARRTAAVTLLGIQTLAPARPRSALLIGAGVQAWAHAQALIEQVGIRELHVATRRREQAQQFCDRLAGRGLSLYAHAAEEIDSIAAGCELVIAATTARAPVIPAALPAATMAVGVGAFKPDMSELPPTLLRSRRVVVDHLAGARHEAGDLLQAQVDWSRVSDLGQVLGEEDGDVQKEAPTAVFKTVGHAAWDLAAARVATRRCMD